MSYKYRTPHFKELHIGFETEKFTWSEFSPLVNIPTATLLKKYNLSEEVTSVPHIITEEDLINLKHIEDFYLWLYPDKKASFFKEDGSLSLLGHYRNKI